MGFIHVLTTHKYFIFILLLFQIYLSLQSKLNQILLYDNINNGERGPPDDIFKRYEELVKSTKALEEKIDIIQLLLNEIYINDLSHRKKIIYLSLQASNFSFKSISEIGMDFFWHLK